MATTEYCPRQRNALFTLVNLAQKMTLCMKAKKLHIISGTTAVGKTEYALAYAEEHDAEIVSCDALLVYKGMDIGTAKPSTEEQSRIKHYLVDVHPVNQSYDIVAYVNAADAAIASITERDKSIVVVGGSGFYLKSFFMSVVDTVIVPAEIRENVAQLYKEKGLEGLLAQLREHSPEGFGNLDILNPRRVHRALERCMASGKSLLDLQAEFAARPEPYSDYEKKVILLEREPEELRERVACRVDQMLQKGLIEEVERLRTSGIEDNPCAASAIGYRETLSYLRGEINRETLVQAIIQNTHHLVKKQRTWFRTQIREPDKRVVF